MATKRNDYLLIGGGVATAQAASGIREIDAEGSIQILSAEPFPPYNRPPLSKGLWQGGRMEKMFCSLDDRGPLLGLNLTTPVVEVKVAEREVIAADGRSWRYRKLLLATGSSPRPLPDTVPGRELVRLYRTAEDYLWLRGMVNRGAKRMMVVGGGFIGAELAASLSQVAPGMRVSMLFPEPWLWSGRLPAEMAAELSRNYQQRGVEVLAGQQLSGIEKLPTGGLRVWMKGGRRRTVDLVVAGVGVHPADFLARQARLEVADGVTVDELGRTSGPDIYACGDVANFPLPTIGARRRVEHEDHAKRHGRQVGRNMAGANEPYTHLPMFYSDLFDLGFEAVGTLGSHLEIHQDWVEPYKTGVLYYLEPDVRRLAGIMLCNVWGKVDQARALLGEGRRWTRPQDLDGLLRG